MTPEALESALSRLLDGELPPEEFAELEQHLQSSPEARDRYLEFVDLHNVLDLELSPPRHALPGQNGVVPIERVLERQKRGSFRHSALAAVALLVLLGIVLKLVLVREPEPLLRFRAAEGSIVSVTHFAPGDDEPESGTLAKGSRLEVPHGTVELTLATGVRSVVQGPADLTLHGKGCLYLNRGSAWFHVPAKAAGFKVHTRDVTITDLGTEFGVVSMPNAYHEVHVFEGKVKVEALRARKEEAQLAADQARVINAIGRLREVKVRPEAFLTKLPSKVPLLVNGGFDTNGGSMGGWTLVEGTAVSVSATWLVETHRKEIDAPQEGTHFAIELGNGSGAYFYQAFATIPNATYELSFNVARPQTAFRDFGLQADVFNGGGVPGGIGSNGDLLDASIADDDITSSGVWVPFRYRFTAASTRTTLRFLTPGTINIDAAVDTVAVTPIHVPGASPEGNPGKQPAGKSPRAEDVKNAPSP